MTSANIVGYTTFSAPDADRYVGLAIQFEGLNAEKTFPLASVVTVGTPKGAKSFADGADQLWVWDPTAEDNVGAWVKYYYSSSKKYWCLKGETTETTATVKNGDSIFFRRGSGAAATTLTLAGGVTAFVATPKYEGIAADRFRFMAYPWPCAMKIKDMTRKNYQSSPKGAKSFADGADQIWYWDGTAEDGVGAWVKYYYSSSKKYWCLKGSTDETEFTIPAGEGFFFRRGSGAADETVTFTFDAE